MATKRGNTCVGYVAPFPIPEVQRHIKEYQKVNLKSHKVDSLKPGHIFIKDNCKLDASIRDKARRPELLRAVGRREARSRAS